MAIKFIPKYQEYVGLSTDDKSWLIQEAAIIYYTDTKEREIYHDGVWSDYLLNTSTQLVAQNVEVKVGDVKIQDGDDIAIGSRADSAVIDPTASSSLIGNIKGIMTYLKNIITANRVQVDVSALPVGANVIGKISQQVGGNDISVTNQLPTEVPCFMSSATPIIRSSTVTAYSAGQIILGNGATTLPYIDISTAVGSSVANRKIAITSAYLISSNGANPAFIGYIDLLNVNNPAVTVSLADYASYTPTAAAMVSNFANTIDDVSNSRKYGVTSWMAYQTDMLRKVTLDANSKLYFAPVCTNTYTPIASESITLVLKYYLLN